MKAAPSRPLTAAQAIVFATLIVTLLAGAPAGAGSAWAHATRIASDPVENAVLKQPPPRVNATFNEPMQAQFAAMTVIGPDGNNWADGEPDVDGAVISIGVRPGGPAGVYTVNYRATSADGHVVAGSWSYRLDLPAAGGDGDEASATSATPNDTPEPTVGETPDDDLPAWPFVAAGSAIIAVGLIWAVRRRS